MENRVNSKHSVKNAVQEPQGFWDRMREKGRRLANNVRLIDLYGRGKDGYKLFEMLGPIVGNLLPSKYRGANVDSDPAIKEAKARTKAYEAEFNRLDKEYHAEVRKSLGLAKDAKIPEGVIPDSSTKLESLGLRKGEQAGLHSRSKTAQDKLKKDLEPQYKIKDLRGGVIADSLNFVLQLGISLFSTNVEREKVLRTYRNLASDELGISSESVKFNDLKKVKNPIVREAVDYYSKKSWRRMVPDFAGLIRVIPLIAFAAFPKLKTKDESLGKWGKKVGNLLWTIAEKIDGIKLLLGAKTAYFAWYFTNRQTGSFYQAESLWDKTEGISTDSNRQVNQNVLTGDFVNQLEIARLYEEFRKEQPEMKLEPYTPNDPLTNRIFEQTARYLNHTYMAPLFKISEQGKQQDLPKKHLTHAMLVELVGSGGLQVQDAMGSALRLEVLAYHGRKSPKQGIEKFREVSKILKQLPHPRRTDHKTQEELVEAVHDYLEQVDTIGREYLGDFWPPIYIDRQLKEGFIKAMFEGMEVSDEQRLYMASALFMRDHAQERTFRLKENDPASAFLDTPEENLEEALREQQYRKQRDVREQGDQSSPLNVAAKKENFADGLTRKTPADILQKPSGEELDSGQAIRA